MSNNSSDRFTRRDLVATALGVGALAAVPSARADTLELPKLALDDPAAKALGYVHDASTVDSASAPAKVDSANCANCNLYSGEPGSEWGPCSIFPGKLVNADGWCRTWVKKPA